MVLGTIYEGNRKLHFPVIPLENFVVNHSTIDSFHIVSAHAPNCLVPRYLREITHEGATYIQLPYITQWNMENDLKKNKFANKD